MLRNEKKGWLPPYEYLWTLSLSLSPGRRSRSSVLFFVQVSVYGRVCKAVGVNVEIALEVDVQLREL